MTRTLLILICLTCVNLLTACQSSETGGSTFEDVVIAEADIVLPHLPKIDIVNRDRFLNDLMLSPYWKVEKTDAGQFIAKARAVGNVQQPRTGESSYFLFEADWDNQKSLGQGKVIRNRGLWGGSSNIFSAIRIEIHFVQPDSSVQYVTEPKETLKLPIYENSDEDSLSPKALSKIGIKLSSTHDIYLIITEQGSDPQRHTTARYLRPACDTVASLMQMPDKYRVADQYQSFFACIFPSLDKDTLLMRLPGIQDRDTFYGFVRTKPKQSYAGINIKISHPVYCYDGECTRDYRRLRKAEYSGIPYDDQDIIFFLIEDNGVYVKPEYDKQFGVFSGKGKFTGIIEVLNVDSETLIQDEGQFTGWER